MDAAISPTYDHTPITMEGVQGQTGVYWHNGFLICGGRISYGGLNATNKCVHRVVGGSVIQEYPMTFPRHLARMVIANGAAWITGGIHQAGNQ